VAVFGRSHRAALSQGERDYRCLWILKSPFVVPCVHVPTIERVPQPRCSIFPSRVYGSPLADLPSRWTVQLSGFTGFIDPFWKTISALPGSMIAQRDFPSQSILMMM